MASNVDAQIRSALQQAHQLEGSINNARARYGQAEQRKRQFEARLREVERIKRDLYGLDGHASTIKQRQNAASGNLERATSGLSHESALVSAISRDLEKNTGDDSIGRDMHSHLQAEISRCNAEISGAQSEMNSCGSTANNLCAQRSNLVQRARNLSYQPDATVKVYESLRY